MKPLSHLQTAWRSFRVRLQPSLTQAHQRYQALALRERRLITGAALLVGAAFIFILLVEPALSAVRKLETELPSLRAQAATVADLTAQASALRLRAQIPASATPGNAELAASLERAGLRSEQWTLADADGGKGVVLSVSQTPSSTLLPWLEGAGRDWGLAITHVELTRATNANGRPLPGLVNGKLTLMPPPATGGR